jgi:competence protein ComEA
VLNCLSPPRNFGGVIDRRKAEVAAYAVAAFVVVLLAARLLQRDAGVGGDRGASTLSVANPRQARASAGGTNGSASGARGRVLVVDVAGEVRRPGVYRVPAGARAEEAVRRAGGVTRRGESTAVNLAMPLHDGQQIVVPRRGTAGSPVAAGSSAAAGAAGGAATGGAAGHPISLSTATVEQLDTLDGIGPTLAGRIVQYREAHGGFRSVEELRQVSGIGDKRFEALRKAVQP